MSRCTARFLRYDRIDLPPALLNGSHFGEGGRSTNQSRVSYTCGGHRFAERLGSEPGAEPPPDDGVPGSRSSWCSGLDFDHVDQPRQLVHIAMRTPSGRASRAGDEVWEPQQRFGIAHCVFHAESASYRLSRSQRR